MHHPTTSPGIPRSVNVIKGGGNAMPVPDESRQKASSSEAAPGQQQARCDEADLLALLKRLGLALSPPSSAARDCGNRNGSRDGDGDEGMACEREEMDTSSPTPAPNNGSYSANGPRDARPEEASAAEALESGSGTAASRRSQQRQHQQVSEGSDAGGSSFDTRQRDARRGEEAAFGRTNEPQSLGHGGGIGNGGRNGDGNDFGGSNSSSSNNKKNYQTEGQVWPGEKLKPGNGRVFAGEMAVGKAEAGSGVGDSSSAAAATTTSGGPCAEASPKDGGAIGLRTVAASEKMVDLMRREITAREALLLGPILRSATGVTCLRLCYNHLRDGGAEAVSSAIESLPSLHSMDLGFNGIGDQGAANLARSLVRNRSLRTLYLSGNSFGAAGATALAESLGRSDGLETLHLSGNCIGPEGASALAEALKSNTSLTRLYIDGAGIKAQGANAVASALLSNSVLSDLHMSDNEIGDESLEGLGHALRRNSSVRLLELCFNRITGAGAEAFSKSIWGCATLRSLRLDNNQIGDRGAQALAAAMPTLGLETLELGFNNVATAGVASLMQATVNNLTLTSLSLSGNALDVEAARSIQSALSQPRCPLKRLSLDHASLAKTSEAYIANGVLSNRSLTLVALTGLHLGAAFARLGMPPQVANFSNEQALEQVRLYWAKRLPGTSKGDQHPASNHSRGGSGGGGRNGGTAASAYGATSEVSAGSPSSEDARKARQHHLPPRAHGAPDERGNRGNPAASTSSDSRPQQARRDQGRALSTPGPRGTRTVTGGDEEGGGAQTKSVELSTMKSSRISSGVGGGAQGDGSSGRSGGAGGGSDDGDVAVARNMHRLLLVPLREIAQMPFSAANLWSLHQHYFSPPVEPRSPALGAACPSPTMTDSIPPLMPPIVAAPAAATGPSAPSPSRQQQQQQQQASPATRAGCGVWWLDNIGVNGIDSRGREDSEAGAGVHGGGRGGGVIFDDDGVGAGARRCRRTSSLGGEDDDEVNSPCPPSKRYRNSSAKIRIACFPAIQARISTLKNKSDERGVLTILRQLKFLESGVCDARPASASSAAGGAPASSATGSGSGPARVSPRGVFGATPVGAGGRVGGGGGGERGGAGVPPKDALKTGPLTDAEMERILLEEV